MQGKKLEKQTNFQLNQFFGSPVKFHFLQYPTILMERLYSNEHEGENFILSAGVPCINLETALFFSVVFIFSSSKESKKLRGLRIINFEEHIAKAAAKSIGSILLTGNYQHKFCCYALPLFPQLRYTKPKGAQHFGGN